MVVVVQPIVLTLRFAALLALVVAYCRWIVSSLLAELELGNALGRLLVARVAA